MTRQAGLSIKQRVSPVDEMLCLDTYDILLIIFSVNSDSFAINICQVNVVESKRFCDITEINLKIINIVN